MSIIKCPECGKDVSDKAGICIHCGYPLQNNDGLPSLIDKNELNLHIKEGEVQSLLYIQKATGCSPDESEKILKNYMLTNGLKFEIKPRQHDGKPLGIVCPRCGSSSITTSARGVNGFWGFIGASKTVNRCAKCGHTWAPRA